MAEPLNNDIAIELLPDDGIDLDPATSDFYDEFDIDPDDQLDTQIFDPYPYGKSWAWDFSARRFVKFGPNPAQTNDLDTLKSWIQKTMITGKGAHVIYTDDYGVENPDSLIGFASDPVAQNQWAINIKEALMRHDRITDVTDFKFHTEDGGESLFVDFSVTTDDNTTVDLEGLNVV